MSKHQKLSISFSKSSGNIEQGTETFLKIEPEIFRPCLYGCEDRVKGSKRMIWIIRSKNHPREKSVYPRKNITTYLMTANRSILYVLVHNTWHRLDMDIIHLIFERSFHFSMTKEGFDDEFSVACNSYNNLPENIIW